MSGVRLGRWDWLLASVALNTLAALVHWVVVQQASSPHEPRVWQALRDLLESPWFAQPLRLLYGVGLPAAVLFWQRGLTTHGLGLQGLPGARDGVGDTNTPAVRWHDWAGDIGWAVAIGAVTGLVVVLGDLAARRSGRTPPGRQRHDLGTSLREAVYYQVHWAFYREPFVVLQGATVGSWVGALPVLVEALLNPALWETVHAGEPRNTRAVLIRGALFVAGVLIYLKTSNLWVAIVVDMLLGWALLPSEVSSVLQWQPTAS
ncbi:MAG: hypothetical protein ACP5HG_09895 [Anaerolineae bacterium]